MTAWPEPWIAVTEGEVRTNLDRQLLRETQLGHVLFRPGPKPSAIARRSDTDDVLYALPGGGFAEVHLVWRAGADPEYPSTTIFNDLEAWAAAQAEEFGS